MWISKTHTEFACFLAWLISSFICEMLRLKLSWSSFIGCSFSSSLSASSSKSFTLAPAAWTKRRGRGSKMSINTGTTIRYFFYKYYSVNLSWKWKACKIWDNRKNRNTKEERETRLRAKEISVAWHSTRTALILQCTLCRTVKERSKNQNGVISALKWAENSCSFWMEALIEAAV